MTPLPPQFPDLAGKVVVVTGASRGIGRGTALRFGASGAAVAAIGRDGAALDDLVAEIRSSGGQALAFVADCTDAAMLEEVAARVREALGPVEILAAFAGGNGDPVPTQSVTPAQWRFVVESNLTATFLTIRAFLPDMLGRRGGSIVTMASAAARVPSRASAAYAAAKAGIIQLTRQLANEMGAQGVRVNCVAPSAIMTERMEERMPEAIRPQLAASFPLGRIGTTDDVADATLFLASAASSWITGVVLDVAGGKVMV